MLLSEIVGYKYYVSFLKEACSVAEHDSIPTRLTGVRNLARKEDVGAH